MNNIWDRLIDALDDDDDFDMQTYSSSLVEKTLEQEAKPGRAAREAKANLEIPAIKRLQTPEPTTENSPTSFFPGRSRASRDGIDRSGGAGNILISVSRPWSRVHPVQRWRFMMIVENGQEYEVPMDGPMAIGMDIAGEMFGKASFSPWTLPASENLPESRRKTKACWTPSLTTTDCPVRTTCLSERSSSSLKTTP